MIINSNNYKRMNIITVYKATVLNTGVFSFISSYISFVGTDKEIIYSESLRKVQLQTSVGLPQVPNPCS